MVSNRSGGDMQYREMYMESSNQPRAIPKTLYHKRKNHQGQRY